MWIIGIDGGGTKCEAGIFTLEGELLATSRSGPANLFSDFTGAIAAIEQACNKLFEICLHELQLTIEKKDCLLSLGCAGGGIESVKQAFVQWPHQYADTLLTTDIATSCIAANSGRDCAVVVIGTGSCIAIYNAQTGTKQLGGHGFLLGDLASGAWLGKRAVSWYLQALETPVSDTALQTVLAAILGTSTTSIVQQYGQGSAGLFAELAPVLLGAKDSSPTVQGWLEEGALYVSNLLLHHISTELPIFLMGGLANTYKGLVEKHVNKKVFSVKNTPVYGAYLIGYSRLQKTNNT